MQCFLDHIVLNVQDMEKMLRFYTDTLQLAPERLDEYSSGRVPFPSIRLNPDTVIDLFPKKMWQENSRSKHDHNNLNHFCISLSKDDWKNLLEKLKANDVDIEDGPVLRWGAHGTGRSIYFRDPEGNIVEARYYEGNNNADQCFLDS